MLARRGEDIISRREDEAWDRRPGVERAGGRQLSVQDRYVHNAVGFRALESSRWNTPLLTPLYRHFHPACAGPVVAADYDE